MASGSAVHALKHDDVAFEKTLCLNLTSTYYATRVILLHHLWQRGWACHLHRFGLFEAWRRSHRRHGGQAWRGRDDRALAYQVPPTITVNTLSPGWTRTSLIDFEKIAAARGIDVKAAEALVAGENVQKRVLEPQEITLMAVLLASEEAGGITGQEISVDGGYKV